MGGSLVLDFGGREGGGCHCARLWYRIGSSAEFEFDWYARDLHPVPQRSYNHHGQLQPRDGQYVIIYITTRPTVSTSEYQRFSPETTLDIYDVKAERGIILRYKLPRLLSMIDVDQPKWKELSRRTPSVSLWVTLYLSVRRTYSRARR